MSKHRMTTRLITLWRAHVHVTSLVTSVSTLRFLIEMMFVLKAILKGHMISRILHSCSFHMKFVKLAKGSFHKFHVK